MSNIINIILKKGVILEKLELGLWDHWKINGAHVEVVELCAKNTLRILWNCGVNVPVYKWIQTPLKPKFCSEIHGIPGKKFLI